MIRNKKGFTLVELIIVLSITAVLISISIPVLISHVHKARGASSLYNANQIYTASSLGLMEWKAAGSPGNSDKAFKINIESEIIECLNMESMKSHTDTNSSENSVQVALSLPSYFAQGWDRFISDCKANGARNFARVWIGKDANREVGITVNAVYYISADGKYVSRIVYDETTKLGSEHERTGTYFERLR